MKKIETLISSFNNDFNTNYESFLEICAYLSSLNIKFVKGRVTGGMNIPGLF